MDSSRKQRRVNGAAKKISEPSPNGKHERPVRSTGQRERKGRLIDRLRKEDRVLIGADDYDPAKEDDTASWADLARKVDGIRWQVADWLPYRMLSGSIGRSKDGKSAFLLGAVVAPIITGGDWFTGQAGSGEPGYVVWCDTERRAAVNLERARKWGLPLDRIKTPFKEGEILNGVDLDNEDHIARIFNIVCRYQARLVVIDSFRGSHRGDENSSRMVGALERLAYIAEETGTSVHLIHHIRKLYDGEELTAESGRGSNAFLAMIAVQWAIDRPDENGEWRRVRVLGENLGVAPPPVGFRITDAGLEFGEAPERARKDTRKSAAEDWLRAYMKPGEWTPAAEVIETGMRFGFTKDALFRAREPLGIVKPGYLRKVKDGWEWMLPPAGEPPFKSSIFKSSNLPRGERSQDLKI